MLVRVKGRVSPAPEAAVVAPFQRVPTRSLPASWHAVQLELINAEAWSYPIACLPPAEVAWQVVHVPAPTDG